MNYYNDNDPRICTWLKELCGEFLLAPCRIDNRSILDVIPDELAQYSQCHFFAGIGGWSRALGLAGWPDDQPVWTASCPCQPFSAAGKGDGIADERHLWPAFKWLVEQCRPPTIFGEQVASPLGREWLAGIRVDLEGMGYEFGGADLCAAGFGAPHIRQRLYWVADAERERYRSIGNGEAGGRESVGDFRLVLPNSAGWHAWESSATRLGHRGSTESASGVVGLDNTKGIRSEGGAFLHGEHERKVAGDGRELVRVSDANPKRLQGRNGQELPECTGEQVTRSGSAWSDYELIPCRDGKVRRSQPGIFPLAYGIPGRVGLLRGYGNAIVPQVAADFIKAAFAL